jgi:DNA-binding CsgD family transcriptional regulator
VRNLEIASEDLQNLLWSAPLNPHKWSDALALLSRSFELGYISYGVMLRGTCDPRDILCGTTLGLLSPLEKRFQREVFRHHPVTRLLIEAKTGDVLARWRLDEASFSNPILREYDSALKGLQPQGGVVMSLCSTQQAVAWLSFNRAADHRVALADDLPTIVRSLAPVMNAAAVHVGFLERERTIAAATAGMQSLLLWHILVDSAGDVVQDILNPLRCAGPSTALGYASQHLHVAGDQALALRQAVRAATGPKSMHTQLTLRDMSSRNGQRILVAPVSASSDYCRHARGPMASLAALRLHDETVDVDSTDTSALEALLTDAERTVAELIIRGQAGKQIASQLSVSLPTIRTHIAHILRKTESRNQVDFVRRVLGERILSGSHRI